MDFQLFSNKLWLLKLFIIIELFVESSLGQSKFITLADLKSICCLECGSSKINPPDSLCTSYAEYSSNPFISTEEIRQLPTILPSVFIIDNFCGVELRNSIKPNNIDEFMTTVALIIRDSISDAVIIANLFEDLGSEEICETDVVCFFDKLRALPGCKLYGLMLPTNIKAFAKYALIEQTVDFYLATTCTSSVQTDISKTVAVEEMQATIDAITSNGYCLSKTIFIVKILNTVINPESTECCSFCEGDKKSIYCQEALDNLYKQGKLVFSSNLGGIMIQSIDHDVAECTCGPFPVTNIIMAGVNDCKEPTTIKTCLIDMAGSSSSGASPTTPTSPSGAPPTTPSSPSGAPPTTPSTPSGAPPTTPSSPSGAPPTTTGGAKDLSILRRMCGIASASSEMSSLPPVCTCLMTYSANPSTADQNLTLPAGDYKWAMVVNNYNYHDLRNNIKPENSDNFVEDMMTLISKNKLSAIILDNLYPTPEESDPTYIEDIVKFLCTLHSKLPDILVGLAIPVDSATLARKDVDIKNLNTIFDFYFTKTFYYNQCKKEAEQSLMPITSPVDAFVETFKALGIAGFDSCKIITLVHITVAIIPEGKEVSESKDDISYAELCTSLPRNERFCKDTLKNFYKKGALIKEYNIFGICFQYIDRDDYTSACECPCDIYPIVQAIEAGSCAEPGSSEPDHLKCPKLDSIE